MTEKYHVNPETGNPNKCTALTKCRFGGDEKHYFSKEAAQSAFEKDQAIQVKSIKRTTAVSLPIPESARNLPDFPDGRTFSQVWNDRFASFAEWEKENPGKTPVQKSPESLLSSVPAAIRERGTYLVESDSEEIRYGTPKGDYVVAINTRQGGGNRECWCNDEDNHDSGCLSMNNELLQAHQDYFHDEDDDYDTTYATFYFDAGITKETGEEFIAENARLANIAREKRIIEAANENKITPWAAISSDSDVGRIHSAYVNAASAIDRKKIILDEVVATSQKAKDALKKIKDGTITEKNLSEINVKSWQIRSILDYSKETVEAKAELDNIQEAHNEAEKMAPSALRDYLLADRGTFEYKTTETVGRRKIPVTRTVSKGTLLGSELKSAEDKYQSRKKYLKGYTGDIQVIVDKADAAKKDHATAVEDLSDLRTQAWAAGWYSDPRALPKIPKDF